MFCRNCGKELPDDSRFCQACGTSQEVNSNSSIADKTAAPKKQTRGIGRFFVKKIFIGSIVSFVVGVIGVFAIFFPSLFNLEKKKIQEFSITIKSQKDANELYNFLKTNNNKIVSLDIKYSPKKIQASNYVDPNRKEDNPNHFYQPIKTIVTYSEIEDNNGGTLIKLYDAYTNELVKTIKDDNQSKYAKYMYFSNDDIKKEADDSIILTTHYHGLIIDDTLYCHISDILCLQETIADFKSQSPDPLQDEELGVSVPLQNSLFFLPNYPYPETMILTRGIPEFLSMAQNNFQNSIIKMDESVLFGKTLSFVANHYGATYKEGSVNVDHGSIGFITDLSDNDTYPYILSSKGVNMGVSESELMCSNSFGSAKIINSFDNNQLVNIYKSQKLAIDKSREFGDSGIFKNLMTSMFFIQDNKLQYSNDCDKIIGGRKFYDNQKCLNLDYGAEKLCNDNIMFNDTFDKSFSIEIPYSTKNNTLYTWKSESFRNRYPKGANSDLDFMDHQKYTYTDSNEMITIKGIFYVYNQVDNELENFMPYHFCSYSFLLTPQLLAEGFLQPGDAPIECKVKNIIKLEPLSSSDLEKRNY